MATIEGTFENSSSLSVAIVIARFNDLITNKLLVAKAEIDSVMVEDNEVNQELDSRMNIIINQVGSEEEIENFYNKTISEFKNELFDDIKQQLVANKMRREILSDISVSPEEVRSFFNNIPKDSIPYFSTQVQVSQVVKIINVGDDQKEKAKLKLIDIRNKLISWNGSCIYYTCINIICNKLRYSLEA